MHQDMRAHGDLTLAPTQAGIFIWRFEQRRGEPWSLKLIHVFDDLDAAISFARAAMARTNGRVWFQERHGVIPIAEAREWESFASSKHAVCN